MGDRLLNVIVVERQIHGYRQGHQLLAGSVQLPREDQSTIDRLSDVAGPLRPREKFDSYLSGYPLPSGTHYVLARTWQDLTVARAGCVRTMSLIISAAEFAVAESLSSFLELLELDRLPDDGDATRMTLKPLLGNPLPPASEFEGGELLEALFLEDPQPVVVFDAPSPDNVATRLLTALWPALRRQFALSTFALSPRKVGGRDFNLVFAPKDARSKFSDWNGRRIDGRSSPTSRHRWTGTIVSRVFSESRPHLLSLEAAGLVRGEGDAAENAAALRIALLWDELFAKLDTTPTAALGLLDIANSSKVHSTFALQALEPVIANAVRCAPSILPEDEAWSFLGAMARKLHGRRMQLGVEAVESAVSELAERAPDGALALLSQPDDRGVVENLLPIIANGIGNGFTDRAKQLLMSAPPAVLGSLVGRSPILAAKVASNPLLIDRFGQIVPELDAALTMLLQQELLPHLVMDWQLPAADPLLRTLDAERLAAEVCHLALVNDFGAPAIAALCLRYAREIGAKNAVLIAVAGLPESAHRDDLLARALDPSIEDAKWLLRQSGLSAGRSTVMFADLLRRATDHELEAILDDRAIGAEAIGIALAATPDLPLRMVFIDAVPLEAFVRIVDDALARATTDEQLKFARRALERCLGHHFGGDETALLVRMLGIVGERVDIGRIVRLGLADGVHASVASRNMIAFNEAPQTVRHPLMMSISEVAQVLQTRRHFDLNTSAADACANLLFQAEKIAPQAALAAAGYLLPMLMRQLNDPVSLMIAATFPMIYRQLAEKDDVPDILKFIPFFDWDRCRAARQELVSAFMSSSWPPGNLALIACLCGDIPRILRNVARAYDGEAYIEHIASDLLRIPETCRSSVEKTISSLRSDWPSKYDWRG